MVNEFRLGRIESLEEGRTGPHRPLAYGSLRYALPEPPVNRLGSLEVLNPLLHNGQHVVSTQPTLALCRKRDDVATTPRPHDNGIGPEETRGVARLNPLVTVLFRPFPS